MDSMFIKAFVLYIPSDLNYLDQSACQPIDRKDQYPDMPKLRVNLPTVSNNYTFVEWIGWLFVGWTKEFIILCVCWEGGKDHHSLLGELSFCVLVDLRVHHFLLVGWVERPANFVHLFSL